MHNVSPTKIRGHVLLTKAYNVELMRAVLIKSPNGCGLFKRDIIPDILTSCEGHDIEYTIGSPSNLASKLRAKSDLRLKDEGHTRTPLVRWIYYIPVRIFGGLIWKEDRTYDEWALRLGLSNLDALRLYKAMSEHSRS